MILFVPWAWLGLQLSPKSDSIQQELEKGLKQGFPGMIVYVDKAGNAAESYAAGFNNRENQVAMTPQTLFKIASISKLYIASAVAKLVAADSLSLDNTLNKLLPQISKGVENSDRITLKMLVQHRSGIPNFVDMPEWSWPEPPQTLEEHYAMTQGKPADFEPNQKYAYSNTNYLFLGAIMDRLLGYSHHQYIQSEVLAPLGLRNTYHLMAQAGTQNVSSGYYEGYDPDIRSQNYILPGGSMISTAEEVGQFVRAMVDGTLFTEQEQAIYEEIYDYSHTGLLPGYQSIARYHSDIDAVVVLFDNMGGDQLWMIHEAIYNRIVGLVADQ